MQPCIPQPSCAELKAGQVLCTARGATGGLSWSLYNGTALEQVREPRHLDGLGSELYQRSQWRSGLRGFHQRRGHPGESLFRFQWQLGGFLNLGGIAGGNPDCTFFSTVDPVVCFAKAIGDSIFVTVFDGGNWVMGSWTTYGNLGGEVNDNASCTSQATGELVCGVIGQPTPGNAFYADVFNGSSWSGWTLIGGGGTGLGSPSCAPLGSGKVVCVIMGLNNKLTSVVGP